MFGIMIGESNILNKEETITFYENMIEMSKSIIKIAKEWIDKKETII